MCLKWLRVVISSLSTVEKRQAYTHWGVIYDAVIGDIVYGKLDDASALPRVCHDHAKL